MRKPVISALAGGVLLLCGLSGALSQDARQNEAGKFDFYVLSLSWSPSYCAAAHERDGARVPGG